MNLSHERLHWDNNMPGDKLSLNPQWLLGLIDADGCFCIIFRKKAKINFFCASIYLGTTTVKNCLKW